MPREIGPIIVPGPAGDEYRRSQESMKALKIQQARKHRALQLLDTVLPDSPEKRKLASSMEKYGREIEKYRASLTQNYSKWQKGTGEVIRDILKLADNAAELYEAYQEYPLSDNFKDYGEDKEKAANRRDFRMSLVNQAISLYYYNVIKELDKLKITDKPEFEEVQHCLNTVKAKMSERADLDKAAMEFERQAGLAQDQIAYSQRRDDESTTHSNKIQALPNRIGEIKHTATRFLQVDKVRGYSEQAEERAKELESVLVHIEKHRRETEAKIDMHISQARKRRNAVADSTARQIAINGMLAPARTRDTNAQQRYTRDANRALATPIGDRTYKNIADRIIAGNTTGADNTTIANLVMIAGQAGTHAGQAEIRAREAKIRAGQAETRAREAETRARIAKAYGDATIIDDELAKDVEKCAKNVENLEKKVVENASLIESKEKIIQNALTDIHTKIEEMQNIMAIAAVTPMSPEQVDNLARLANEIEKIEMAKNSAMTFEVQAANMEQKTLRDVIHELQAEFAALGQEHNNAQNISNLANPDMNVLQNLVAQQRTLEDTLRGTPVVGYAAAVPGLIQREREQSQAAQAIEQVILYQQNIRNLKTAEATSRTNVQNRRTAFRTALTNVMNTERAAAEALKRNAIHMERDVISDANQAIERLQNIKDNLADQDDKGLKNRSEGHLYINPRPGKFTLGDEAIWMSVKEIDGWEPPDPARPGETRVRFRPDIVKIEVETITREAQGGKLSVDPIYTKRLTERYFRSDNYQYTLDVPGGTFANGGRRQAVLTIIDLKKQDGRIARPGGGAWTPAEYTTIKRFPMEATGTIRIRENHNNQSSPVEVLFSATIETMPNPVINHAQALARRQGKGWSDEQKRRMCKLDLDRRVLILPNGQEYSMDEFDWTETKWDEDNGLTLEFKGPRELSQLNLLAAVSDIFDEKLSDATIALKEKKRKHFEEGIELLKQSIKSYDEEKINKGLGLIQSHEGIEAYQSSMTKNELERPPKNRLDLEKLRRKKKAQREALTPKWVAHATQSTTAMLRARQGYENEMKKRIRAIHKDNSLSATRVWRARAYPERYALVKHRSSKKKQELLDEIRAAEHLDKTLPFQLLEDPKYGLASPVKNTAPNGLELLREYNLYKNKKDFANGAEQAHVAQYVAIIATEFETNPAIHPYYTNQWYLEQAIAAANNGNFLSKEVNGEYIIGASDYLRNLKQVDCPPTSDDSLAGLRQADEYRWVTYLRDELAKANTEGMAELLQQALPIAKWMQEFRYGNLELAKRALDLETPSEDANRIVNDMQTVKTPQLWPKVDKKPTVGKGQKPDGKIDPKAITKKSDGELALDAARVTEQIHNQVVNSIESRIASTYDPFLQKRYREEAVKMIMAMSKEAFQIHKQDKDIQNQWQKLEVYIKEMNTQRWKDFAFTMAIFAFQQGPRAGADGAKKFMDEILKIIGKAVV